MSREQDGGPAFPRFTQERVYNGGADRCGQLQWVPVDGMSLRDYFAGQALIALMSSDVWVRGADEHARREGVSFREALAHHAYMTAEWMLQARQLSGNLGEFTPAQTGEERVHV